MRRSSNIKKTRFEGWYFKHHKGGETLAFIPGRAGSGAFVQLIGAGGSRQFDVKEFSVKGGVIRADGCAFSARGAIIDLPGVAGDLSYGELTPLRSDIMGPFRHLPMECRHEVVSMRHALAGSIAVDGREICFDGGVGYIERDSGTSFPKWYRWIQCNDFSEDCSVMASVAAIPFLGFAFTGCICAIVYRGKEYRLATYNGARVRESSPGRLSVSAGKLLLEIDVSPGAPGHALRSPVKGEMSGVIRESNDAAARFRLREGGELVFDLSSDHAGYEFVK
ncbi:MAG TPA: tocopherol cyclase family protein [Clostridia bacterium]|nr:tocopherol cyclase family protein [Clostridia bacterium]